MEAYLDYRSIECVPLLKENTKVNNMFIVLQMILTYIVLIESNHVSHLPPSCAISENCWNFSRFRRLKMCYRIFLFGYGWQLGWINQSCFKWVFPNFFRLLEWQCLRNARPLLTRWSRSDSTGMSFITSRTRKWSRSKRLGRGKNPHFPSLPSFLRLSIYQRCSAESQSR